MIILIFFSFWYPILLLMIPEIYSYSFCLIYSFWIGNRFDPYKNKNLVNLMRVQKKFGIFSKRNVVPVFNLCWSAQFFFLLSDSESEIWIWIEEKKTVDKQNENYKIKYPFKIILSIKKIFDWIIIMICSQEIEYSFGLAKCLFIIISMADYVKARILSWNFFLSKHKLYEKMMMMMMMVLRFTVI